MPIRNLDKIFEPKSVVVIGATERPASVGKTVLDNLVKSDFNGAVYAVNPKYRNIGRTLCFSSVGELPEVADLAIVCTPAQTVPGIVHQCGEAGIRGLVILSAGFREASDAGELLEAEVRTVSKRFSGMRIIGPNCLGIMAPHLSLNASFAGDSPPKGHVAFISQSGALCTAILDWALQESVGFSHFVSVGNMIDVGVADLIDYFALDNKTESIILYVESINEAREFMSAARAFTRTKPIIAYKAGRFSESAKAATSHTGAMAGVDSVYEAALARAGVVRVFEVEDLFDCAELLARQKPPMGPRLAIVTNAGGPGVMATDALLDRHGILAVLSEDTVAKLSQQLPAAWSRGNPVDVLGDAPPERYAQAIKIVLEDDAVDGVLVVLSPQAMTDPSAAAIAVVNCAKLSSKPIISAWMGGGRVAHGIQLLNEAGIPTYSSPEKGVRAFMHLVSYVRTREMLYETPHEVPLEFSLDRTRLRGIFESIHNEGHNLLTETRSKSLLEAYEIPVTQTFLARSKEDAVMYSQRVGFPVALKVCSQQITHKTEVAGVELNLTDAPAVLGAFDRILNRAKQLRPDAEVAGVTVQRMLLDPNGRELIVGAKRDPVFGMVLLVGAGGTSAELFQDRALELPPLNERLARRMLETLKTWPLLRGYRGRPGVNVQRLIEVLMRLSYLIADNPEIVELDVNPLLATPRDAIAMDARIVLDQNLAVPPARAYSHLAIRPYPHELTIHTHLKNQASVVLRAIKPEDEPMWSELVASCSTESLHLRFGYAFRSTHEMAARFCFCDYDREIAIVAEIEDHGNRRLIGVSRLVADPDHLEAEFAILVSDSWQGFGLGSQLTDYCLDIGKRWGVPYVVAEVASENDRMIRMFEHRGFQIERGRANGVVTVRKHLA